MGVLEICEAIRNGSMPMVLTWQPDLIDNYNILAASSLTSEDELVALAAELNLKLT